MAETASGSCLCGGFRFEVTLPFTRAIHCHCSRCRKRSTTLRSARSGSPRSTRAPWDELPDDGVPRYPDAPPPD
jgi:hypothetical protein